MKSFLLTLRMFLALALFLAVRFKLNPLEVPSPLIGGLVIPEVLRDKLQPLLGKLNA